jgi:hypothetical protein
MRQQKRFNIFQSLGQHREFDRNFQTTILRDSASLRAANPKLSSSVAGQPRTAHQTVSPPARPCSWNTAKKLLQGCIGNALYYILFLLNIVSFFPRTASS